jgi:hypothetical protein
MVASLVIQPLRGTGTKDRRTLRAELVRHDDVGAGAAAFARCVAAALTTERVIAGSRLG